MENKKNKTTQVVRAAMKAVAKDVRAPKVVRDGIVKKKTARKKKSPPSITAYALSRKPLKVLFAKLNKIKFKEDKIVSVSEITKNISLQATWDELAPGKYSYSHSRTKQEFGDVILQVNVGQNKVKKLMKLFNEQLYGSKSHHSTLDIYMEGIENHKRHYHMTGFIKEMSTPLMGEGDIYSLTFSVATMENSVELN